MVALANRLREVATKNLVLILSSVVGMVTLAFAVDIPALAVVAPFAIIGVYRVVGTAVKRFS